MNAKFLRNGIVMLVLVLGTVALMYAWFLQPPNTATKGYSDFLNDVQNGKVTSVPTPAGSALLSPGSCRSS